MAWLVAVALAAWLGVALYGRLAGRGLAYRRAVTPDRLFPGETAELALELENRHRLPLPWVIVHELIPESLRVGGGARVDGWPGGRTRLVVAWRLGGRRRLRRRFPIEAVARGAHRLGPADAWWVDPVGRRDGGREFPRTDEVVVYPRLVPLPEAASGGETPFGTRPRPGWLHHDPLQVVGVRPFQAGDPYRRIHWPATARTGGLQVRQISPAQTPAAMLCVDVGGPPDIWARNALRLEGTLSVAATLAVRLLADGRLALTCRCGTVRLGAAAGPAQARRILELFARAEAVQPQPLEGVLVAEAALLPPQADLLIVSPRPGPGLVAVLGRLGRSATLWCVGAPSPPGLPARVRGMHVSDEQVRAWLS